MGGRFVWHELVARDTAAAATFYSDVIGWKTERLLPEAPLDYTMWVGRRGPVGGVMRPPQDRAAVGVSPHWVGTVEVDDLECILERARARGGSVPIPIADVPRVGRVAVLADPQGATLQVLEPPPEPQSMSPHDPSMPPRAPSMSRHFASMPPRDPSTHGEVAWNELHTSDAHAAFDFYAGIFGWAAQEEIDMGPDGAYIVYGQGDERFGGIMTRDPDTTGRPVWIYYIHVDDLEDTMARASTSGARVDQGPLEVPDGSRIAHLTDPQGVMFALHAAAPAF